MSFKDIKGQDRVVAILREAIDNNSVAKAYIFSGPEGVGKKQVALALAAALNCEEARNDGCGKCASCRKIKNNQHPDVLFIEDKNNSLKIEDIRQMQRRINLKAYEGRKKVCILDNAHNLTAESSNALLKTLEEPPADSVIILVSSKPSLLFKTILSRCRVLRFYPLARKELEGVFRSDYGLDSSRAHFLSYFSEGRLGDALRLKDTGFYQEKNKVIDEFALGRQAGFGEPGAAQTREGLRRDVNILMSWFRDICLLKIGLPQAELINFDRRHELAKLADKYELSELNGIFDFLSNAILHLEQNVNVRLLVSGLKAELWKR